MSNMSEESTRYAATRVAAVEDLFTRRQIELLELMLAAAHVAGAKFATDLVASAWREKPVEEVAQS